MKIFNPLGFKTNFYFLLAALTFFIGLTFAAQSKATLTQPLVFKDTLSPWQYIPLEIWVGFSAMLTLLIPIGGLIIKRQNQIFIRVVAPYVILIIIQVFIEAAFELSGYPAMSLYIGLVFTIYRLIQLLAGRGMVNKDFSIKRSSLIKFIIMSGLIFWSMNFIFLTLTTIRLETFNLLISQIT